MDDLVEVIHAIDLCDFYPCHNIGIDGRLMSPDWLAKIDPRGIGAVQKPIGDIPITQLREGHCEIGIVTPRFVHTVIEASILRQGRKIVNGRGNELILRDETIREKIIQSDIELAFEEFRRNHFPHEVSRLSCIYLAERTCEGRTLLREMFGASVAILDVRITGLNNVTRCNVAWFDEYCLSQDEENIDYYWSGKSHPQGQKWEYLLDGQIEIEDSSLLRVLEKGTYIT